jgi:plastocyanin
LAVPILQAVACGHEMDPTLQPDAVLQAELGLTLEDRVYRVSITGGEAERAEPAALSIEPGAYVEFVTTDWLVHEVIFETDSLEASQRSFLLGTDQMASPPLIEKNGRYVLTFAGAPPGKYVYRLEGNGRLGRGTIVVTAPPQSSRAR